MIDRSVFRAALEKLMPGYSWTVHRAPKDATKLVATGTQASGFNRLSTLEVSYTSNDHGDWFDVRSSGYGLRAPWLGKAGDKTLARALRGLQDYYQRTAATYHGHARALEIGRKAHPARQTTDREDGK